MQTEEHEANPTESGEGHTGRGRTMVEAHSDAWLFCCGCFQTLAWGGVYLWESFRLTCKVRKAGSDRASPEGVHSGVTGLREF